MNDKESNYIQNSDMTVPRGYYYTTVKVGYV